MIRSMTGFGAGRGACDGEEVDVEVRSVNHKYCEVKVRIPRELSALEHEVVRSVKERLARGGVDVAVRRSNAGSSLAPRVDVSLAESYARAFAEIQARLGLPGAVTLADVLAAEGVVRLDERAVDLDRVGEALRRAVGAALGHLVTMRAREGEALARDLGVRLDEVERLVGRIATLAPEAVDQYRIRLSERVAELSRGLAVDPARLAQEVAIFADRSDVAEEITRLRSHLAHVTLADTSQGMLTVLREKIAAGGVANMTPLELDLTAGPAPEARYDLVCTLMTLHHIADIDGILARFHDLLVPGGRLCVSALDTEDGSFHGPRDDVHLGFDRQDLAARMARAGFHDIRFTTPYEIRRTAGGREEVFPLFLALATR